MRDPENPLLVSWTGPYGLPPFSRIEPAHYPPAFDITLAEARAEIEAIANDTAEPTFDNTIAALERSGERLTRVASTFFNLTGAHTSPDLQAIERDLAPKLARHSSETLLNQALFSRIERLWQTREALGLDPEQARVLDRYYTMFQRAGAGLTEVDRTRMSEITQELAVLGTQFSQNVLADEAAYHLVLDGEEDLAGLPPFLRAAASEAADERGLAGKHVITLSRSLIEPFLQFSTRRDLREAAFTAWSGRGEGGGDTDNREIISRTLTLRRERAQLLGFDDFAAYKLDDSMAKTPHAVRNLLESVWQPAVAKARNEAKTLQDLAAQDGDNIEIAPWDWHHYCERVRQRDHAIDEAELKPYLQLDSIVTAAFETANRLFGLTFQEEKDLDLYHPDVRAFSVRDRDGTEIGLFLGDYFARASKRSGAWMSAFRKQQKLGGDITPIIVNVMNFAKAPKGQKTLLTFDDAHTLFHEFGHALHGLLSNVTYPMVSGTSVSRDFVELPSQLYEHWLDQPEILQRHAIHVDTGAPMPQDLIERVLAAQTFNSGFETVEYLASALFDLDAHTAPPENTDASALETSTLARLEMPKQIAMRHRPTHFAHVFSGEGYASGYYSYMWSEVMDADAFTAFQETGDIFDPTLAEKLHRHIYSAGGRQDPKDAYTAFRGSLPDADALLKKRGFA
ncbi:M3 family metallopeptidase [Stappia sp. ES.058]|uniref:M3 family metallopeptidase n=1 Tax=Stappia sp. ES.058 TaxID=1881061 RepID=UPI00087CA14C|nr:M3 family metallopeptidase [Stappia sp. ES.058]SDU07260.1 peptidyl-dipeptidase Dcp [Stappia sp. ES.058]